MSDHDPRDQITHLETRLDELAEAVERCRKVDLASKIAMSLGGLWMLAMLLGIVNADLVTMIGAMTAVIGGIVVFGSNTATARQLSAAMADAEALRAELIGGLQLRVVNDEPPAPPDGRP
jgi:hypothetical protein